MRSFAILGIAVVSAHKKGSYGGSYGGYTHAKKSYVSAPATIVAAPIPEVERTVNGPTCPEGFAFNGRLCEQSVRGEMQVQCAVGQLIGGQCISNVALSQRCPPGFQPSADQCIQRTTEPRNPFCPQGYTDVGGRCQMRVEAEVVSRCEVGQERNGECVVRRYESPIVNRYCPAGFLEGPQGCYQTETFDCTPVHVSHPQVKHVHYGKGKGHGHGHKTHKVHLKHAKVQYMPAPIPQRVEVVQKMCERQIAGQYIVERSCPVGTIDDGQRCMSETVAMPVQICTGMGGPSDCYVLEYASYLYNCPEGTVDNGRECVTTIYQPFEQFCPAGSQNWEAACARITSPRDVCEAGFQMQGSECLRSEFAQPQYEICTICTGESCVPRDAVHSPVRSQPAAPTYVSYSKKGGHGKHH